MAGEDEMLNSQLQLKSANTTNMGLRRGMTNIYNNRQSTYRNNYDFSMRESNNDGQYNNHLKNLQQTLDQQRSHQYKLKDKFLVYLKRYPLYVNRILSERGMEGQRKRQPGSIPKMTAGLLKLQLASQNRIEEEMLEDEEESNSYMTSENVSDNYHTN